MTNEVKQTQHISVPLVETSCSLYTSIDPLKGQKACGLEEVPARSYPSMQVINI